MLPKPRTWVRCFGLLIAFLGTKFPFIRVPSTHVLSYVLPSLRDSAGDEPTLLWATGRGKLLPMKTFLLASLLLAMPLFAQDVAPSGGRIATRTRTVAIFDDLERQLMNAVEKKDAAALKSLSTDDFEMRRAADPATPVPRDEWIANELPSYELRSFRISGMAVHMFGDSTATVSMNYWQDATVHGRARSGDFFIVDVWTKAENSWKLAVRYVSPTESRAPGARKPTGRE